MENETNGSSRADVMGCARFVVAFDGLDEVLDETNTLIEVQGALFDVAPGGVQFNCWNERFALEP